MHHALESVAMARKKILDRGLSPPGKVGRADSVLPDPRSGMDAGGLPARRFLPKLAADAMTRRARLLTQRPWPPKLDITAIGSPIVALRGRASTRRDVCAVGGPARQVGKRLANIAKRRGEPEVSS